MQKRALPAKVHQEQLTDRIQFGIPRLRQIQHMIVDVVHHWPYPSEYNIPRGLNDASFVFRLRPWRSTVSGWTFISLSLNSRT